MKPNKNGPVTTVMCSLTTQADAKPGDATLNLKIGKFKL
jgi:hypothetical protein